VVYRFKKFIFALVPIALLVSIRVHLMVPAEGDKGWLLHATHMWLSGSPLYDKIFEVNPPLIIWLYALPILIANHLPVMTDYQALAVIGLLSSVASACLGMKLITYHPAFEGKVRQQLKFGALLLVIYIFYTTQAYFFDREHIMIVFGFPYIIRFMPQLAERKVPVWLRVVVGLFASLAFCIKPHAMLIFACVQAFTLMRTRSVWSLFNLENSIVGTLTALYMAAIYYITPDYFRIVVPMAYWTYYTFRNENAGYAYLPPFFIGFGLVFADFRPWQQTPFRKDVLYLAGLCLAGVAYAKANNGWGYTFNPAYCILMLTTGWMLWEYDFLRNNKDVNDPAARNVQFGLRGCFIVFIAHAAYMCFYLTVMTNNLDRLVERCAADPQCYRNSPYVSYFLDHNVHSYGTISFDFSGWVSLMRSSGTDWVSRFNHVWMLPELYLKGEAFTQEHYWIVDYVAKGIADDMNTRRPDVMLVDSSPGLMGLKQHYSLLRTLNAVPEFKDAWSHYHYSLTFNGCGEHYDDSASECKYDLYTREQ